MYNERYCKTIPPRLTSVNYGQTEQYEDFLLYVVE